jgi:crotonobetainyl-CoA:carnitine CoA-transferase CaiB-like acyl-CoA transferase
MNCLRDRRILTLAQNLPGPLAAAELRAMGAAVLKIEPPWGDPLAVWSPDWYAELTAEMTVVRLDLKEPSGAARIHEELSGSDLMLTSSRLSSLERLGLRWSDLHARYPRLSWVAIVGHPTPRQDVAGHDLTYQSVHGLIVPPAMPRTLVADLAGAKQAVIAAVGLLLARERDDRGGYEEIALASAAKYFAEPLTRGLTAGDGMLGGALPVYRIYRARDGWIAIAALEPRFRLGLTDALGVDTGDARALADAFAGRSASEWEAWAEAHDLPIVEVREPPMRRQETA